MIVKYISTLILTATLTACTIPVKQQVIVGSGTMYEKWQKAILEECSKKANEATIEVVVRKTKEGMLFTEKDVIEIHAYLLGKCSLNSGVVI